METEPNDSRIITLAIPASQLEALIALSLEQEDVAVAQLVRDAIADYLRNRRQS